MKRFILRSLVFAALLLALVGSVCWAEISAEIKSYRAELKAPEGANALICSASKMEKALDPEHWPGLFNFCASGRMIDQVYFTAEDLFAANPGRFRYFILELSPEVVREDLSLPVDSVGFAAQYYLLYLLHWKERIRPMTGIVKVARDNLVGRRLREFTRALRGRKRFKGSLASGFTPSQKRYALTDQTWFKARVERLRLECDRGLDVFGPDSPVLSFADRIVDLARANGAEVVVLSGPLHPQLIRACGADRLDRFARTIEGYAARKGCRCLNLIELDLPDDCWFDGNHLNSSGARVFTERVRNFVTSGCQR